MRAGLEMRIKQENWKKAAISASNLSELELTLGEVAGAVGDAEQSVSLRRPQRRCVSADGQPHDPRRRPAPGGPPGRGGGALPRGRADAGRAPARLPAAVFVVGLPVLRPALDGGGACRVADTCSGGPRPPGDGDAHRATLQAVSERAAQTLKWAERINVALLDIALNHLTLGRAALYAAILEGSSLDPCRAPLQHAVDRPPPRRPAWTTSPAASSPAPGCGFSKAIAPAPRARRATWTKPGKSPSAAP